MRNVLLAAVMVAMGSTAAHAETVPDRFGPLLEGALEFGGDSVAQVFFTDGSDQKVKAGQGVTLSGGFYYRPSASFDIHATAGYKFVTTKADNADITLTRVVLKLTGDYELPNGFRVGGGLVEHVSPKFEADNLGSDIKFKSAVGLVGSVGWRWIGVTYTSIDYKAKGGGKVDASNIGVLLTWEI